MHGLGLETGIDNPRGAAPDARPGHGSVGGRGLVRRGRRRRAFFQKTRRRARARARAAPRLDFGDGPRRQAREGEAVLWVLRRLKSSFFLSTIWLSVCNVVFLDNVRRDMRDEVAEAIPPRILCGRPKRA